MVFNIIMESAVVISYYVWNIEIYYDMNIHRILKILHSVPLRKEPYLFFEWQRMLPGQVIWISFQRTNDHFVMTGKR
jgi:hypothetical protein